MKSNFGSLSIFTIIYLFIILCLRQFIILIIMKDNIIQNIYKLNDDIKNIIYDYFVHFQFIEKKNK